MAVKAVGGGGGGGVRMGASSAQHAKGGAHLWTDARRPVPRLWIRSAEVRGERR